MLALQDAVAELDAGAEVPRPTGAASTRWCSGSSASSPWSHPRSSTEPSSNEHQVDALSGTLAALITEVEEGRSPNAKVNGGNGAGAAVQAEPEEVENGDVNGEADLDEELEPERSPRTGRTSQPTRAKR